MNGRTKLSALLGERGDKMDVTERLAMLAMRELTQMDELNDYDMLVKMDAAEKRRRAVQRILSAGDSSTFVEGTVIPFL